MQEVAATFGGGGHRNAAGATLNMPMQQAVEAVISILADKLGLDGKQA